MLDRKYRVVYNACDENFYHAVTNQYHIASEANAMNLKKTNKNSPAKCHNSVFDTDSSINNNNPATTHTHTHSGMRGCGTSHLCDNDAACIIHD